jgi:hypothetical protein
MPTAPRGWGNFEESYCLPPRSGSRSCRRYQPRTRVSWMEFFELLPTFPELTF